MMVSPICSFSELAQTFPRMQRLVELEDAGDISFRQYQFVAALQAVTYGRGVVRLATGSGKTLVMAMMAAMLEEPVIIALYGNALLEQTIRELHRFLGEPIGCVQGDEVSIERVTVASIPTLVNLFKRKIARGKKLYSLVKEVNGLLVFDEVHHASADTWQDVAGNILFENRIGMSGTPVTFSDVRDLKLMGVTGPLIVSFGIHEMQQLGYVSQAELTIVEQDFKKLAVKELDRGQKSKWAEVNKVMLVDNSDRLKAIAADIVEHFKRVPESRAMVLTGNSKDMAINLYELLKSEVNVVLAHGSLAKNTVVSAFDGLRSGKYSVVVATKLADEGIDVPGVDTVFLVGGGKSYVKTIQRIGRGLRKLGDDKCLMVVDYMTGGHRYVDEHNKAREEIYTEEGIFQEVHMRKGKLY